MDKVIKSVFIGEHVADESWAEGFNKSAAEELCVVLNRCLRERITVKKFKSVWNKLLKGDFDDCSKLDWMDNADIHKDDVMSIIKKRGDLWFDVFDFDFGPEDILELYKEAVEKGADRFVLFNNNAYFDIVAISGTPSGRDIAIAVLDPENVTDWTNDDTRQCVRLCDGRSYI